MTIVFESLGGTPTQRTGSGSATFRLTAGGIAGLQPGQGYGSATLEGFITTSAGGDPPPPPPYSAGEAEFLFVAAGEGNKSINGSGAATFRFRALGWGVPNHGVADFALEFDAGGGAAGQTEPPEDSLDIALITEALVTASVIGSNDIAVVREAFIAANQLRSRLDGYSLLQDGIVFGDSLTMLYYVLVTEGFVFSDAITDQRQALERCVERLILSGQVGSVLEAVEALIAGIAFGTLAESINFESVTEGLVVGDALASHVQAIARAVESLVLSVAARDEFTATVVVHETLVLGDPLSSTAELYELINESIAFLGTLTIDNGEYIAWVLNTESKGLSTYDNYPFNSFAKIGKRYYGCASDGVHRLEGTTDNGDPINWRLRLALNDLGTRKLKRVPEVFFMMATDGQIYVQVVTVDEDGDKAAAIYKMKERAGTNRRENRQKLGKGLKSIDFGWVLEPVDGAALDLTGMEMRPMVLDRRTRG